MLRQLYLGQGAILVCVDVFYLMCSKISAKILDALGSVSLVYLSSGSQQNLASLCRVKLNLRAAGNENVHKDLKTAAEIGLTCFRGIFNTSLFFNAFSKEAIEAWKKAEAKPTETTTESTLSAASSPEDRSPGILTSFLRGALSWPLRVTRDLLDIPSRLSNWMHGFLHAAHLHFRDNAYNYTYLYELLSLGVPLLCALLEVLTHMYREAELSLENVLEWVKRFCRV